MTKEIMQQYEYIRKMGVTNMFDYNNVIHYANQFGFDELANLNREEYKNILMNFSKYMKKFDIKQEIDNE